MCLVFEQMMAKAYSGKRKGIFTIAKSLTDVVTGKEDANYSVPNGKYKFFTCSNDILCCDDYVFDSSSVLIAGNGDFNVKHYSGKFNASATHLRQSPSKKSAELPMRTRTLFGDLSAMRQAMKSETHSVRA